MNLHSHARSTRHIRIRRLPKTGGYVNSATDTMSQKAHGLAKQAVQKALGWNVDRDTADRICNFNRHYAEYAGYWKTTKFLDEVDLATSRPSITTA